ncbi:MAG: transposase [Nitrospinae bacterium]|nr:transposase [Nitrospinota bacterium]
MPDLCQDECPEDLPCPRKSPTSEDEGLVQRLSVIPSPRYGTTQLVMTPLEFLQRLAALVPRPRLHLIRFHGVLAPNAALRSQIVPSEADSATDTANGNGDSLAPSTRARLSWA